MSRHFTDTRYVLPLLRGLSPPGRIALCCFTSFIAPHIESLRHKRWLSSLFVSFTTFFHSPLRQSPFIREDRAITLFFHTFLPFARGFLQFVIHRFHHAEFEYHLF